MKIEEANTCCEIIKAFIEKNETSVNNKTPAGLNPLTVAVKLGSTSLVNFLLEKKADPNCMDHMNDTPLSLALIRRDEKMVRSLIKARANVNHCGVCPGGIGKRQSLLNRLLDENGYTTHLSKRVLVSLAQFLIENGTSVNHDEEGNDSPLIQAVRLPSYDLVDSLLAHGANVNHPGKNRSTALHECFRDELLVLHRTDSYEDMDVIWNMSESDVHVYGDPTTDIFQCLIEAGASVNSQTDHGDTPIHLAIKGNYFELTSKMLNKDFNPNIQNCDGTTCLMLVVNRHHNLTQHLLNIGADPSIKDNEGNTTLHHFCSVARETVILNILLRSGSDINALNNKGYSPLNTMIEEKAVLNTQDVLELLAQNADPNICVDGANSPLINSLLRWKLTIAECLLNAGVNVNHVGESRRTALHTLLNLQLPDGIEDEVVAIVRCLLIAAADVNFADISGRRPLEIVVDLSKKNWDEVKILELTTTLINHGAKYNDYEKGDDSLLHMAVDNRLQEVVDFLVRNGADINHRGKNQQIPLHRYTLKARKSELPFADRRLFSHQKPLTIMDNLLCMIEDPDVEDEYGDTPLNLVSHIHTDDFRKLLKAGADPLHKGKENVNAYENCIMSEEVELLEVLLQEKGLICITDSLFSDFWNLSTRCDGKLYERVMLPMLSTNDDIDLNRENSSGDTPLTFFCQRNATEVISKLLERGADINLTTTTGRSALHSVLDLPDNPTKLSTIAVLMSNNPDLEGKDASGETVLQKTIEKYFGLYRYRGSKCLCTFMEHLLNAGATCDQSDLTSVLQSASERQHFSLMTAAVKRGADLFNKKNGKGVLHRCWPQTFKDEVDLSSMLEECIAYINTHKQLGGCLDEVDDMGNTPLLAYVKSDLYAKGKVCEDLSDEVVASLATSKDVVCKADVANVSPLHITASRRRLNSMKILVNKGADLFSKDKVENSCLHNCLFSNEGHLHVVDMVRYILENGISPNEDNKRLDTSLFLIIQRSEYHTEDDVSTILELLIKHGANPNQGKSYRNPLVTAIQKFDIRSTAILLKNGANVNELSEGPTALHVLYRCFSHSYSTINENIYTMQRLLLKKEMNLNAKDIEGKTVLHLAVIALSKSSTEYTEAVKLIQELMKRGADVNATDNRNLSALCICCKSGYCSKTCIKLGKHLLKAGADTLKGCTLNLALKRTPKADLKDEWKTFILQLVANGASTNARLGSSSTPSLILAIKVKDMDIVKALLEHGADSNAFDYIGTSLIHACRLPSMREKRWRQNILTNETH
ncbi:serine/threonine-protein phosphatase 6 regulatory ankyrin repeat subunit B-like isoform X2 [Ostrea edulis]|uniref:serine/threonine-protein phosphatase 6 regulatory ankyrin repeat subunit B-like isoform X2 n=1 Tax=Ostrea edulis TaxID=37623 RepID=UPI0024AF93BA|nr:serine/threonine-protein phosphatase 6 regulatory ankyrin repeat subunit B-like isoform X2 [Ostrea edulis]